jgi:hypothetical protein
LHLLISPISVHMSLVSVTTFMLSIFTDITHKRRRTSKPWRWNMNKKRKRKRKKRSNGNDPIKEGGP